MVGDEMVDIVTALPPANGQATTEVGNENTYQCIIHKVLRDASMASIMCGEHYLVLGYCQHQNSRFGSCVTYPEQAQ